MEHLGDITKLNGSEIPKVDIITFGAPCQDISIAGKRAGMKSKLMGDEENTRSGLFYDAIRIIKEMRESDRANGRSDVNVRPRYAVYENVPGAFSSNKGEDFRCVLEETAKIADSNATIPRLKEDRNGKQKWSKAGAVLGDGWSIAWRVHDAQFWGVPQRRKRISLVADFAGTTALEILFEPKSLYGNIETSREKGQGTTTDAERSAGETSTIVFEPGAASRVGGHIYEDKAGSLRANAGDNQQAVVLENHPNDSRVKISEDGKVQTLSSRMGTGGGNVPMDMENTYQKTTDSLIYANEAYDKWSESEKSASLRASGGVYGGGSECLSVQIKGDNNDTIKQNQILRILQETYGEKEILEWGIAVVDALQQTEILQQRVYEKSISREAKDGDKLDDGSLPRPEVVAEWLLRDMWEREKCRCTSQGQQSTEQRFEQSNEGVSELPQQNPQTSKDLFDMWEKGQGIRLLQQALHQIQKIWESVDVPRTVVRRLTPLEAERLQGYPDGWTDIGEWYDSKGKKHKDADSPRYKALGNSIALPFWEWMAKRMVKYINHEVTMGSLFDGIGGFPLVFSRAGATPIWASEVEEFPIAVTKLRFKE